MDAEKLAGDLHRHSDGGERSKQHKLAIEEHKMRRQKYGTAGHRSLPYPQLQRTATQQNSQTMLSGSLQLPLARVSDTHTHTLSHT
jgi:hypothetical protein